ncbi:MAG: hypothetical protein ACM3O3_13050 [Syntrophothermus sp.]
MTDYQKGNFKNIETKLKEVSNLWFTLPYELRRKISEKQNFRNLDFEETLINLEIITGNIIKDNTL